MFFTFRESKGLVSTALVLLVLTVLLRGTSPSYNRGLLQKEALSNDRKQLGV
jgi:hypothetical protein